MAHNLNALLIQPKPGRPRQAADNGRRSFAPARS